MCSHCVETYRSTPPSAAGIARPASGPERRLVLHRRLVVALDPDVRLRVLEVAVGDVDVAQHVAEVVDLRRVVLRALPPCR